MFHPTKNFYRFKYLICVSKSKGLEGVYLPEQPSEDQILFKKENKFVRPVMPDRLLKAVRQWKRALETNPNYVSPLAKEISEWEDEQWKLTTEGAWIMNGGVVEYITAFYWFYLTAWITYFGPPIFRDTDKEICYALQYCEEDPDSYGALLNTIRRYGKSSIMAAWAVYRTIRNFGHYTGMQAEKDSKAAKFYNQMMLKPFLKLPYYFMPTYDTTGTATTELKLERAARRGKNAMSEMLTEDTAPVLESYIDYRPSGEEEYDGAVLMTYLMEEPGKTLTADVNNRWKTVKPCLRKGRTIRGKAFMGTTVEWMDAGNKGGRVYKKLFFDSDFGDRGPDGRTRSGLYAFFLPGDCAYEGYLDEFGRPMKVEARQALMDEREAVKDNPKDYSDLIRKYPIYVSEIFYISSEKCVFNAKIIQDRIAAITMMVNPIVNKFTLSWQNNVRFSRVIIKHDPVSGWAKFAQVPDEDMRNRVDAREIGGEMKYFPKNDANFRAGVDPIDHALIEEEGGASDEEGAGSTSRRSRPVLFVKRMYQPLIDGYLTQEVLEQRAREKYEYKTGKRVLMMDQRPNDPNIFYERALMICWLFGCTIQVEHQKPGLMNWFVMNGCEAFLQQKYIPLIEENNKRRTAPAPQGTPANTSTINEYTDALAIDIEYFGHVESFIEFLQDCLVFNPRKTTAYDYAVAGGWTELACKARPKNPERKMLDLHDYLPVFDKYGNVVN